MLLASCLVLQSHLQALVLLLQEGELPRRAAVGAAGTQSAAPAALQPRHLQYEVQLDHYVAAGAWSYVAICNTAATQH